jgi:hypothetical protein
MTMNLGALGLITAAALLGAHAAASPMTRGAGNLSPAGTAGRPPLDARTLACT